ncbi:MAG: hypothetical protein N838_24640 [Thiohalocapsa sp. PB-PSB1]|nr:MAG: hypothetical protein N838_24640 [Thiohalocapsa sp. PB-PSB1]
MSAGDQLPRTPVGYDPLAQPEPEIEFDQRIQW